MTAARLARKRYLLWDHDGVLVDTEGWFFEATQRALAEAGVTLGKPQYLEFRRRGETCWALAHDAGLSDAAIAEHRARRNRYYQDYLRSQPIEIPGVPAALATLRRHCVMAIVTTSRRVDFELIHASRSIVDAMTFVLTNEDYAAEKPAPDPYVTALERLGAAPEATLVIEDSAQGLASARAAGIDCVIVKNHFFADGQDFDGAVAVLEAIEDLPRILQAVS